MSLEIARAVYPSLRGKKVIITGGATGIGAAFVQAFVRQGAQVGLMDIDHEAAHQLIRQYPGVQFEYADVRLVPELKQALSRLITALGGVDVLINNAANDQRISFSEITEESWDDSQAVNLRHHVFASQRVAEVMREQQQGVIINLGSVSWQRGNSAIIGYATAKAAIHGFTRCLARELGPFGIRVNSLMPGAILTEKQVRLWRTPEETARFHQLQALPIDLQAEDVAAMALFLAADDSRGITGQNFIVDAGLI